MLEQFKKRQSDAFDVVPNAVNYIFTNHYNEKLNKCFVILERDLSTENYLVLYNAYENTQIGELREFLTDTSHNVAMCEVNDLNDNMVQCKDYDGFKQLTKIYMQD